MTTTLKHQKTSYPVNPEILKILVQTTTLETQSCLLSCKSYNPDNPGSDKNPENHAGNAYYHVATGKSLLQNVRWRTSQCSRQSTFN